MAGQVRQILSLDGGGVRGALSVAFLERIEGIYAERGERRPLAERFDLIGGTSTGAVIGTALALGLSAAEVKDFYFRLAPRVFRRSRWRLAGLHTVFDARALRQEVERVVGDRTLDSPDLKTHLAIVTKRMDTGSAWIVTTSPRSPYWEDPADGAYVGNRHYALASLVRASTAAPYFFEPERIAVAAGAPAGLFIDGGVTPYNNPALALLQVATVSAYGFGWPTGVDELRLLSVGTGSFRARLDPVAAENMTAAGLAIRALMSVGADCGTQVLTWLHLLGRTETPWFINTEVGDLGGELLPEAPLFSFLRYDVRLERDWLSAELGIDLSERRVERLKRMDLPENVGLAYEVGEAAAEKLVRPEHLRAWTGTDA